MEFLSRAKAAANRLLYPFNLRIDSLTAERLEITRLIELDKLGHFADPVFPVLPQFTDCDASAILEQIRKNESKFEELLKQDSFPLLNDYYTTPDAEVLYAIVQLYAPAQVVEVGSGYSTQLFRLAIRDANLTTQVISIDPHPRQDISRHSDRVIRQRVESTRNVEIFQALRANDILFVDSSHELKSGNDVLYLLLQILPQLQSGVLIHIHDIFLPFEYPKEWLVRRRWDFFKEQYLVQAMLTDNPNFEVIWPGYYLQRTMNDFQSYFKHWHNFDARSLWLRRL